MLLKNYYLTMGGCFCDDKTKPVTLTNQNGDPQIAHFLHPNSNASVYAFTNVEKYVSSKYTSGIAFGDGTDEPQLTDCWLAGSAIPNLTVAGKRTAAAGDDGAEVSVLYTITNNNEADVTISELCYVAGINYYVTATDNSPITNYFAIDRTVLEEPITIPTGGVGQVTYTIRMNYPTA